MKFLAFTVFAFLLQECTSQTCPDDWTHFQESCYLIVTSSTTWLNSKIICQILRSHLVEVASADENNFVTSMMKQHGLPSIWGGLHDFAETGRSVWSTSLEPATYTNWGTGQPDNNGGVENCMQIYNSSWWNDNNCDTTKSNAMCEQS